MPKHRHVWGKRLKGLRRRGERVRVCINGWCPRGLDDSGRTFNARPERSVKC